MCKIFYSWQSDLLNRTNRTFIQEALERAAKTIRNDESIQVEPVVDRDTTGVPGSPDISTTIFGKIDQADVFLCDVSIINQATGGRPSPNPNVLIELGYVIKVLGFERIIMVMNTAFGSPELLPFDLKMRRVTAYHFPGRNEETPAQERKKLENLLTQGLRDIFSGMEPRTGEIIDFVSPKWTTKMNEIQKNILKAVKASFDTNPYNCIDNDKLAKHFYLEPYEIIFHVQELSMAGYVTTENRIDLSDMNGERPIIMGITPKGRMAAI